MNLVFGSLGFTLIATAALAGRVRILDKKVSPQDLKRINGLVNDATDRIFARVALNSQDKTLVSHDIKAFPARSRSVFRKSMAVGVLEAKQCLSLV